MDTAEGGGREQKRRGRRRARSISGSVNYLGEIRIQAGLSQTRLGELLGCAASRISRRERMPPQYFAGRGSEIIAWAQHCGLGPGDIGIQTFLLETGNAPWARKELMPTIAKFMASLTVHRVIENISRVEGPSLLGGETANDEQLHFGEYLGDVISGHNITPKQLARMIGYSRSAIYRWLRGERLPPRDPRCIDRVADSLELSKQERQRLHRAYRYSLLSQALGSIKLSHVELGESSC